MRSARSSSPPTSDRCTTPPPASPEPSSGVAAAETFSPRVSYLPRRRRFTRGEPHRFAGSAGPDGLSTPASTRRYRYRARMQNRLRATFAPLVVAVVALVAGCTGPSSQDSVQQLPDPAAVLKQA